MFLIPESVLELPLFSLYRSRIFLSSAEWVFLPSLFDQARVSSVVKPSPRIYGKEEATKKLNLPALNQNEGEAPRVVCHFGTAFFNFPKKRLYYYYFCFLLSGLRTTSTTAVGHPPPPVQKATPHPLGQPLLPATLWDPRAQQRA